MIRAIVAEDSPTTRLFLTALLRADAQIAVVAEACDGVEAVKLTKQLRPHVVTMDIQMPRMDGFEASRQIMVEAPTPIVIVSGSVNVRSVEISMHALRAGALTVLPKPPGPAALDFEEQARRFVTTVKAMSQVKVVRRWSSRPREAVPVPAAMRGEARARAVALGASTGGPAALARILSELPGDLAAPLLIVQHIAPGFIEGFATWLNSVSAVRVRIAQHGEPLCPHVAYLSPDDRHLGVSADGRAAVLQRAAPIGGFAPSATFLFESVAKAFGPTAVAVILTGMGEDGVEGLRAVRRGGGRVLAQDEETSVIFGMPGAAVAAGLADMTLSLGSMALHIAEMVGGTGGDGTAAR